MYFPPWSATNVLTLSFSLSPFLSDTLYFFSQTPFLKQKIPREEGKEARKRAQLGQPGGGQEEIRLKSAKRKYLVRRGDLGFNREREWREIDETDKSGIRTYDGSA